VSIITISHEAFGHGRAVAERVAQILGYRCISREVLLKASERYGIAEAKLFEVLEEEPHHWWAQWLESRRVYRISPSVSLPVFFGMQPAKTKPIIPSIKNNHLNSMNKEFSISCYRGSQMKTYPKCRQG
jgi:hypothetical protein